MLASVKNLFGNNKAVPLNKKKTLSGTLELLTLFDLLLSLNQNGHSGELHVSYDDAGEAGIFLLSGQVCRADYAGQSGEAALIEIFIKADNDPNASFYFEASKPLFDPDRITVKTPVQELLFKIALELDHHRRLS